MATNEDIYNWGAEAFDGIDDWTAGDSITGGRIKSLNERYNNAGIDAEQLREVWGRNTYDDFVTQVGDLGYEWNMNTPKNDTVYDPGSQWDTGAHKWTQDELLSYWGNVTAQAKDDRQNTMDWINKYDYEPGQVQMFSERLDGILGGTGEYGKTASSEDIQSIVNKYADGTSTAPISSNMTNIMTELNKIGATDQQIIEIYGEDLYNEWKQGAADEGVDWKLDGNQTGVSRYLDRARTHATEEASGKGLLNSSMAAGAAEGAAIDAAGEVAAGDVDVDKFNVGAQTKADELKYSTAAQVGGTTQEFLNANSLQLSELMASEMGKITDHGMAMDEIKQKFENDLEMMDKEHLQLISTMHLEQTFNLETMAEQFGYDLELMSEEQKDALEVAWYDYTYNKALQDAAGLDKINQIMTQGQFDVFIEGMKGDNILDKWFLEQVAEIESAEYPSTMSDEEIEIAKGNLIASITTYYEDTKESQNAYDDINITLSDITIPGLDTIGGDKPVKPLDPTPSFDEFDENYLQDYAEQNPAQYDQMMADYLIAQGTLTPTFAGVKQFFYDSLNYYNTGEGDKPTYSPEFNQEVIETPYNPTPGPEQITEEWMMAVSQQNPDLWQDMVGQFMQQPNWEDATTEEINNYVAEIYYYLENPIGTPPTLSVAGANEDVPADGGVLTNPTPKPNVPTPTPEPTDTGGVDTGVLGEGNNDVVPPVNTDTNTGAFGGKDPTTLVPGAFGGELYDPATDTTYNADGSAKGSTPTTPTFDSTNINDAEFYTQYQGTPEWKAGANEYTTLIKNAGIAGKLDPGTDAELKSWLFNKAFGNEVGEYPNLVPPYNDEGVMNVDDIYTHLNLFEQMGGDIADAAANAVQSFTNAYQVFEADLNALPENRRNEIINEYATALMDYYIYSEYGDINLDEKYPDGVIILDANGNQV